MASPFLSSSLKWSHVAQCGTRLELAISTRGAHSCVRNTPTGLPDCTSSVSSASRSRRVAVIASNVPLYKLVKQDKDGKWYEMPKRLVRFATSRIMTDEQKEAAAERMRKMQADGRI